MTEQYKLPIILWSWGGKFSDDYIARAKSMLSRNLKIPHRFVIISDSKATRVRFRDEGDQVIPLWSDLRNAGGKCFVRLKTFHPSMRELIGPRFAWMDLDMVIVDDVTNIFGRTEDFVISGVEIGPQPYNGSLVLMDAGSRSQVFDTFDVHRWRTEKPKLRYGGSDQAWIAICLGEKEATWTREDGLFCYRDDIRPRDQWNYESWVRRNLCNALKHKETGGPLPKGARIVQCNGPHSPWRPDVQRLSPWVTEHWR